MSVVALKPYDFPALDSQSHFHGSQLLYISWDEHLMFCAPFALCVSPDTKFADVQQQLIPSIFGYHPDCSKIDWNAVQWFKSGKPWSPNPTRTLADNGLRHKDVIRFRTPGLSGIGNRGI